MIQADTQLQTSPKQVDDQVQFLLRVGKSFEFQQLNNMITGDLTLPLIGKYSRNQYHFLNVDVVLAMQLNLNENKYSTELDQHIQIQQINLPQSVQDILHNIPEQIPHNKAPPKNKKKDKGKQKQSKKQSKQNNKQNKQKTIDQYFQKQQVEVEQVQEQVQQPIDQNANNMQQEIHQQIEQPIEQINIEVEVQNQQKGEDKSDDEIIPLFHPLTFKKSNNVRFTWTVSSLKTNKILQPLKQEPCLSYVNHNWVFEAINFEYQKKLVQMIPICVVDPMNIIEYEDQFKSISFNQLRSEYMSVHLGQGGSLCFSPNNMKITINPKSKLATFWTIILSEDGNHMVYHHWIILDEDLSQFSQAIAKESKTIEMLLNNYQALGDEYSTQVNVLKQVYNIL